MHVPSRKNIKYTIKNMCFGPTTHLPYQTDKHTDWSDRRNNITIVFIHNWAEQCLGHCSCTSFVHSLKPQQTLRTFQSMDTAFHRFLQCCWMESSWQFAWQYHGACKIGTVTSPMIDFETNCHGFTFHSTTLLTPPPVIAQKSPN